MVRRAHWLTYRGKSSEPREKSLAGRVNNSVCRAGEPGTPGKKLELPNSLLGDPRKKLRASRKKLGRPSK
jgi:hypothetical protein